MSLVAGAATTSLTPFWGVELTGWGYYLERRWQSISDDLRATALAVDDGDSAVVIISLDLMVIGAEFTKDVRDIINRQTGIPKQAVLVACTHTHNAPSSQGLLGVGEVDPLYEQWAARQAATAAIQAWQNREPVTLHGACDRLAGLGYNRSRPEGPLDMQLTTLRLDRKDGRCLAMVVNYQAHPTVTTVLQPAAVSRDAPGMVCDLLAAELDDAMVMYLQGACGDVNFLPEFSDKRRMREPAQRIAAAVLAMQHRTVTDDRPIVRFAQRTASLPTRRWTDDEINADRDEAERRLRHQDVTAWQQSIGRFMTNRPQEMVTRHGGDEWKAVQAMCRFQLEWTSRMLQLRKSLPDELPSEVQGLRIGPLVIATNSSELFSSWALQLRERWRDPLLMIACYANGRIGYVPDAYDLQRGSYAAVQSPKYCLQFPFVEASGGVLCDQMLAVLQDLHHEHARPEIPAG